MAKPTGPPGGRRRRRAAVVGLAVALVVVVVIAVAVGRSSTQRHSSLDLRRAEPTIVAAVSRQVGLAAAAPRCPADVASAAGTRFRCTLTVASQPLRIDVIVRPTPGDLEVRLVDAVIRPARIEADLRARLRAGFQRSFTVGCGAPAPRVLAPGSRFQCLAGDATSRRAVDVTVRDASGAVDYRVR